MVEIMFVGVGRHHGTGVPDGVDWVGSMMIVEDFRVLLKPVL